MIFELVFYGQNGKGECKLTPAFHHFFPMFADGMLVPWVRFTSQRASRSVISGPTSTRTETNAE